MNAGPRSRRLGAPGWVALVGGTSLLHRLGRAALGPPPLFSGHQMVTWWQQRGPLLATFALFREILWWTGCYLVAVSALAALAGLAGPRRSGGLIRSLSRCHLPGAKTVVRASIGASALGASLVAQTAPSFASGVRGPHGQADASTPAAPPVLRYVGAGSKGSGAHRDSTASRHKPRDRASPPVTAAQPPGPAAQPPVAAAQPPVAAAQPPVAAGQPPGPAVRTRGTSTPSRDRVNASAGPGRSPFVRAVPAVDDDKGRTGTWTVRPGDSLWSIAASTLAAAWGHPPDGRDLARYWWQVVQINRPLLPVPADPNLLFPGDQVVVPPAPTPMTRT